MAGRAIEMWNRTYRCASRRGRPPSPNLFAFPAQSNFSGVKHPLSLIDRAQERGWRVLLDATAFAPTNPLDLNVAAPDFVVLSFYKMFGYPTGLGAQHRLHRNWPLTQAAYPAPARYVGCLLPSQTWTGGAKVDFRKLTRILWEREANRVDRRLPHVGARVKFGPRERR